LSAKVRVMVFKLNTIDMAFFNTEFKGCLLGIKTY
jgi:hypothetical protein